MWRDKKKEAKERLYLQAVLGKSREVTMTTLSDLLRNIIVEAKDIETNALLRIKDGDNRTEEEVEKELEEELVDEYRQMIISELIGE